MGRGADRPHWSGAAGGLAALAAGLLTLSPLVERLELRTHYARFQLRGARQTGARIVIAEITDQTRPKEARAAWGPHYAAVIGDPAGGGWSDLTPGCVIR